MRGIPVILATAVTEKTGFRVSLDDPDDRDWLQVDAWVDKPVDPQTLLQEVGRLTRARQSG
jgi:CheY-like chemotaxis protein